MKKCLTFILAIICILGLVGCHNSPRVTESNGQYQVYLKSDVRTEVLSSTAASNEEMNISINFQTSEGPKNIFVELWIRSGEDAKWDLLDSKTLSLSVHSHWHFKQLRNHTPYKSTQFSCKNTTSD